jgi:hypothetical protein
LRNLPNSRDDDHNSHLMKADRKQTGILRKLGGGDLRSIGKADEIVETVLKNPALFAEVFAGLLDKDRKVRMRAADAVEKVTRQHPEWLLRRKRVILDKLVHVKDKELRWHVAQLLPRLKLSAKEKVMVVEILTGYLEDSSSIVKTCSMQALADLATNDEQILGQVRPLLERLAVTGTPAMKSRGRKLLEQMKALD